MNERDARLLKRLLTVLGTLDNGGEIIATVHQIRRIAGRDGFQPRAGKSETVSMLDDRRDIATRLHKLAGMLRLASAHTPEDNAALQRAGNALATGGEMKAADLRLMLGAMMDIMSGLREQQRRPTQQSQSTTVTPATIYEMMDKLRNLYESGHEYRRDQV